MDKRKLSGSVTTVELGGQLAVFDVDWWYLASIGVEWRQMAQEGTDVESLSGVCGGGVEWRRTVAGVGNSSGVPAEWNQGTGVVCWTDNRLPVVFKSPVTTEAITVFSQGCAVVH